MKWRGVMIRRQTIGLWSSTFAVAYLCLQCSRSLLNWGRQTQLTTTTSTTRGQRKKRKHRDQEFKVAHNINHHLEIYDRSWAARAHGEAVMSQTKARYSDLSGLQTQIYRTGSSEDIMPGHYKHITRLHLPTGIICICISIDIFTWYTHIIYIYIYI